MLPTFVIGLREGLEASLIVGIIAAFLGKQGRRDLLRWVFAGVAAATALCLAAGVALEILSRDLPQRQQEGLETVVGALAVGMVSYMVVWMRRHSRELKGALESAAADALASGSAGAGHALVVMAFLAVLREGLETVVFLLAAFNETGNGASPIIGAILGIVIAIGLGYGIYRGGVRLNLSKFFRATGLVLVLVAGGLVVTALHTAHEAGWLDAGQQQTVNLSWLAAPGTVRSSLLTGILGVQAHPVAIEIAGWIAYVVPLGLYVAWPPGRGLAAATTSRLALAGGAVTAIAGTVLALVAPHAPAQRPVTTTVAGTAQVVGGNSDSLAVRLTSLGAEPSTRSVRQLSTASVDGMTVGVWQATTTQSGGSRRVSASALAAADGGRLPIGLRAGATYPVTATHRSTTTVDIVPSTRRIVGLQIATTTQSVATTAAGVIPLGTSAATRSGWTASETAAAMSAAHHDASRADRRDDDLDGALGAGIIAGLLVLGAGATLARPRLSRRGKRPSGTPARDLVRA